MNVLGDLSVDIVPQVSSMCTLSSFLSQHSGCYYYMHALCKYMWASWIRKVVNLLVVKKSFLFVFPLQGGYVYIIIKCENAGLPIGLQILNVHLGTAPLAGLITPNFFLLCW